jgi:hypothetical protein
MTEEGGSSDLVMNSAYEADALAYVDPIVQELVSVLKPHVRGLRRWSVMRAMRENRKRQSQEVPPKFEVEIERVFRRFSSAPNATFYRPAETTGEVWALHLSTGPANNGS